MRVSTEKNRESNVPIGVGVRPLYTTTSSHLIFNISFGLLVWVGGHHTVTIEPSERVGIQIRPLCNPAYVACALPRIQVA